MVVCVHYIKSAQKKYTQVTENYRLLIRSSHIQNKHCRPTRNVQQT